MAERKRNCDKEGNDDDLPVYLARPGTAEQVPRQKYGGMFSNVEGAYESKTIDFEALSVGQRGNRTARTAKQEERGPTSEYFLGKESVTWNDTTDSDIKTTRGKEFQQFQGDERLSDF
ncbi:hypothetical protein UPYG_G00126840 [Umbra pygmaea]|uniref:Uncharacterized protein n=1 Tax=Umbra pygmaea TaxID=75934 RepID=A0ABD0XTN6_UMBPY